MSRKIDEVVILLDRAIVDFDRFKSKIADAATRREPIGTVFQTQYVLMVGDVINGLQLYGTFSDVEGASNYAESDQAIRDDVCIAVPITYARWQSQTTKDE